MKQSEQTSHIQYTYSLHSVTNYYTVGKFHGVPNFITIVKSWKLTLTETNYDTTCCVMWRYYSFFTMPLFRYMHPSGVTLNCKGPPP